MASLEIDILIHLYFNNLRCVDHYVQDGQGNQIAYELSQMNAEELIELIKAARERLAQFDIHFEESQQKQIRLRISKGYKITLPDLDNTEIHLKPLCKVLFILYLRHPEGINFKDLNLYESEMFEIYGAINRRGTSDSMRRSIRKLTDSTTAYASVYKSQLTRSITHYIDRNIVSDYCISGGNGSTRKIRLDRTLVEWE